MNDNNKIYIAHLKESGEVQTVKQHLEGTANLAKDFSINQLKGLNYKIGLYHDIGKYQKSFQKRIAGDDTIKIPHAVCGAKELEKKYRIMPNTLIAQYCIAGHHSGLHDAGTKLDNEELATLFGNLKRETEDYSRYQHEDLLESEKDSDLNPLFVGMQKNEQLADRFAFLTRYCFSCLTDADSIDTAEFCNNFNHETLKTNFQECAAKVDEKLRNFKAVTTLQKTRNILQAQAMAQTAVDGDIFLMNMPTGSGKTLCSVHFALERLLLKKKKRIIYIIPYNSIIDQTAQIFEEIFGDSINLLRHQSSFIYENEDGTIDNLQAWKIKSTENWDAEFIITTSVQFFQSIYGNKRGKLRKLHNMAESILIFDEAHMMNIEFLDPCLRGILNIVDCLKSEVVFLTATMPDYSNLLKEYAREELKIVDLIPNKKEFDKFQKCKFEYIGAISDEELINCSGMDISKLIIVNTKKKAKEIFDICKGKKFHLSTYMTGVDRAKIITQIKEYIAKLSKKAPHEIREEDRLTVISTSLIEAGVDLDFHAVYRELAGLENILQAGGRCNREGLRSEAKVVVFEDENNKKPSSINANIARAMFSEFEDISNPEVITQYYERLFESRKKDISKHSQYKDGKKPIYIDFKTYVQEFKLIDDSSISIIIPQDDNAIKQMNRAKEYGNLNLRKVQKSVVSVSKKEFDQLLSQGIIDDFQTGAYFLINIDYYDKEKGIQLSGQDFYI